MDREIRQDFPEQQIPEVQMQQTPVEQKRIRIMTDEHKRRMAQNRKINNACGNCGMKGHFMKECTAPKREGSEIMSKIQRETEPYNLGEDFMHSRANASYAQIYNGSSKQRENFHQVFKRGNPQ